VGILRTVEYIVTNPRRSTARKVVDVTALCALWLAVGVSAYMNFVEDPMSGWEPTMFILVALAVVASARSWYQYPKARRSRGGYDSD
jgi:hypothetical protein